MKIRRRRDEARLPYAGTPDLVQSLRDMLACPLCGAKPPKGHGERSKCPGAEPAPLSELRAGQEPDSTGRA